MYREEKKEKRFRARVGDKFIILRVGGLTLVGISHLVCEFSLPNGTRRLLIIYKLGLKTAQQRFLLPYMSKKGKLLCTEQDGITAQIIITSCT